jgi:N-acetylneuraminic acid mutarotase
MVDAAAPELPQSNDGPSDVAGSDMRQDLAVSPTGPGAWKTLAPMSQGRESHAVAAVGGLILVVGGFGSPMGVAAFDPKTNTWSNHTPLPMGADHINVASVGDKLYLLSTAQSGNTYEYNPLAPAGQRAWTPKKAAPVRRPAAAVGVVGTMIYLAGGFTTHDVPARDVLVYNTADDTWDSTLPPLPIARSHVNGAVVGNVFYVLGGREAGTAGARQARVDALDTTTRVWSVKLAMPMVRSEGAVGTLNGLIIFAGGEGAGGTPYASVLAYDPTADQWSPRAPLAGARHAMGGGVVDGKFYVPGGASGVGGTNIVSILEEFTP